MSSSPRVRLRVRLARGLLRLFGWRAVGRPPEVPAYVVVAAPHTSNWDLVVGLLAAAALEVPVRWVGKEEIFRGPMGPLMRALGGIPIRRGTRSGTVRRLAEVLDGTEPVALGIAPEGTRSHATHWKTGFYHIALAAGVPVALGFLDYPRRRTGLGPSFLPSGDLERDFELIRSFYADKTGRRPERQHEPRLPPPADELPAAESQPPS